MPAISTELLQAIGRELADLAVDPADLPAIQAQLTAQQPGLAALETLDLTGVEPATVLLPGLEGGHGG